MDDTQNPVAPATDETTADVPMEDVTTPAGEGMESAPSEEAAPAAEEGAAE